MSLLVRCHCLIRSRRDFSRLTPAQPQGGPTLAILVRPRSEDLFAKRILRGLGKKAWFSGVGLPRDTPLRWVSKYLSSKCRACRHDVAGCRRDVAKMSRAGRGLSRLRRGSRRRRSLSRRRRRRVATRRAAVAVCRGVSRVSRGCRGPYFLCQNRDMYLDTHRRGGGF